MTRPAFSEKSSELAERKAETLVDDIERLESDVSELRNWVEVGDSFEKESLPGLNFNRRQNLKRDVSELEDDLDELKRKVEQVDQRVEAFVAEEAFEDHVDSVEHEIEMVSWEASHNSGAIDDVNARIDALEERIEECEDSFLPKPLPFGLFVLGFVTAFLLV